MLLFGLYEMWLLVGMLGWFFGGGDSLQAAAVMTMSRAQWFLISLPILR